MSITLLLTHLILAQRKPVQVLVSPNPKEGREYAPVSVSLDPSWHLPKSTEDLVEGKNYEGSHFVGPDHRTLVIWRLRSLPTVNENLHKVYHARRNDEVPVTVGQFDGFIGQYGLPNRDIGSLVKLEATLRNPAGEFITISEMVPEPVYVESDRASFVKIVLSIEPR